MRPNVGEVVDYKGHIGRACKDFGTGFWCVQFAVDCLRIHENRLKPGDGSPPECTATCKTTCSNPVDGT
jgi:hypothetical protein